MSFKVFTNGSVLNASELNEFLMNQSVIAFSNSAARASAIPTPVEGMLTYLEDTNTYQFWNGSAWQALVSGGSGTGNVIINGAMEVWQRGTSFTPDGTYTADRFRTDRVGSTVSASRQSFTPGTAPVAGYESAFFLRNTVTSVAGSGNYALINQPIEDVRTLAGQSVTLSFWAKADAAKSIAIEIAQTFGTGGSSSVNISGGKIALTTSWARYTATVTLPPMTGQTIGANDSALSLRFWLDAGSNFNARTVTLGQQNITFDLWGVQLEAGSSATAFRRNGNNIEQELAACQRYYQEIESVAYFATGTANNTTDVTYSIPLLTTMRATPAMSFSATGDFILVPGSIAITNLIQTTSTPSYLSFYSVSSSGLTAAQSRTLFGANANSRIRLSSEL
jgi:hypothetical protein